MLSGCLAFLSRSSRSCVDVDVDVGTGASVAKLLSLSHSLCLGATPPPPPNRNTRMKPFARDIIANSTQNTQNRTHSRRHVAAAGARLNTFQGGVELPNSRAPSPTSPQQTRLLAPDARSRAFKMHIEFIMCQLCAVLGLNSHKLSSAFKRGAHSQLDIYRDVM